MNSASANAVYSPNEWPIPTFGVPSFLIAHAIIPSAVATRSIPEKFNKLRPIFYIVGFLGLASIITFFCLAYFNVYEVLQRIYPSFWQ